MHSGSHDPNNGAGPGILSFASHIHECIFVLYAIDDDLYLANCVVDCTAD
jgi:hypothetical protein